MPADLDARARDVIDANRYLVLGTVDPGGRPRLSPVYFTAARYTDFYWVSGPDAHHTHNLARHSEVSLVIFDSTAAVGDGQAVYVDATARQVPDADLSSVLDEAFDPSRGGRAFTTEELTGDGDLRLFVAHAHHWELHVPAGDPGHGRGLDHRAPVDPTRTE